MLELTDIKFKIMAKSTPRKYSRKWFIEYFEAIPEDQWTTGWLTDNNGKYCALGHCGLREYSKPTKMSLALMEVFGGPRVTLESIKNGEQSLESADYKRIYEVNDKSDPDCILKNPKSNILNFLKNNK